MSWKEPVDLMPQLRTRDVFVVFVGTVALVLALYVSWNFAGPQWKTPIGALAYECGLVLVVAIGVGVLGFSRGHFDWAAIGFRRCSIDWIVRALLIVPLLLALASVIAALTKLVDVLFFVFPEDQIVLDAHSTALTTGLAFVVIVLTPIAQEALLRGVLFAWARRYLNFWIAACGCSIIFGMVHIGIERPGTVVIFSVISAALYEKTRSLWPSIAMHVALSSAYFFAVLSP